MCDLSAALSLALRCGALAHARLAALCFGAAVSGGGKDSLCDLRAALSPAPVSPLCGGAPARARLAALCFRRRFPAAAKTFCATFGAALPPAPGSPPCAALSLALGSPPSVSGGGFRRRQRLFVRPSGVALARARLAALCFRRRFPAAAKTLCATFRRRSRSRSVRRFVAVLSLTPGSPPSVSGGGKGSLCDLRAALSLTLGSPLLWRRSRAARFAARSARAQSCAQKNARAPFLSTGSRLKYP